MRTGKYSFKDLFVNRYIDQIVIPEIQRDYVWGEEQVEGLLSSIVSGFKELRQADMPFEIPDDELLKEDFKDFYNKRMHSTNIGFIYAYCDEELAGRYFLIDGQQRITTLFLALLALVNRNSSLKNRFVSAYMLENSQKLDYRVRESARVFLRKFCEHCINEQTDIEDQTWFYDKYLSDATIKNLTHNYKKIHKLFDQYNLEEASFFWYLEEFTEFWYFDTNISEQGEELYIYMNARGEHVQSNENIKADLLSHIDDIMTKDKYGRVWEEWQDFFWLHKAEGNENADQGFNEFLACISGLENYLKSEQRYFYSKDLFDRLQGVRVRQILKTVNIEVIERYMAVLRFLEESKQGFCSNYSYCYWVNLFFQDFWGIFNLEKTNWYADYNDENRGAERNKMVFVWSILYYFNGRFIDGTLKFPSTSGFIIESFRFIRMMFLRYKNYNRSVKSLKNVIDFISNDSIGVLDPTDNAVAVGIDELEDNDQREETDKNIRTAEELSKNILLNRLSEDPTLQRKFEEVIWEIEDHPFNLNGRDVGGTNISHIVDLEGIDEIDELEHIRDKLFTIFPENEKNFKVIQSLLLHYGSYWMRISPWYYFNYKFDEWTRIIRGKGEIENKAFKAFFDEFLQYTGSLSDLLSEKRKAISDVNEADNLRDQLIWYNSQIKDSMWAKGNYIAVSEGHGMDPVFGATGMFINTRGSFRSDNYNQLSDLLPEKIKKQFNIK